MQIDFQSFDLQSTCTVEFREPDRYRHLYRLLDENKSAIRGSGLSYVAAGFAADTHCVGTGNFNRILAYEPSTGEVEVEAGITLGSLFSLLLKHDRYLPVQPGYPQISVGGCIAANVHGKNQFKEGLFGASVRSLRLYHPDRGIIEASPSENPDVFNLTVGGYGLSGLILSARLKTAPLPATEIFVEHIAVSSLKAAYSEIERQKDTADMIYAWNDLSNPGRSIGKGYLVVGKYGTQDRDVKETYCRGLGRGTKSRLPNFMGGISARWINRLYLARALNKKSPYTVPLFDFLFPALGKEIYFDLFGKAGFVEHQIRIPIAGMSDYTDEFMELFNRHEQPIALTTLKRFGGSGNRHLDYDGEGYSFTIDVARSDKSDKLLSDLDVLNTEIGAITNLIKDSRISSATAAAQYQEFNLFGERLHAFDPKRRFVSELSIRLKL